MGGKGKGRIGVPKTRFFLSLDDDFVCDLGLENGKTKMEKEKRRERKKHV